MKRLRLLSVLVFFLPTIALGATFTHNISIGTIGTDVSSLQQFLTDEGLYTGPVTATFGLSTKTALIAFQKQEGIIPASGYFGPITRVDANTILAAHPEWTTPISNNTYYKNVNGNSVHSPVHSSGTPAGATAQCRDGSYSFSLHHSGTCSHHGGVAQWLQGI
jgi:peptidoglycan hydrolase-like protein with peptidoglycan-binding domain